MSKAKIFYFTLQDEQTKKEKLEWFEHNQFEQIPFDHITPELWKSFSKCQLPLSTREVHHDTGT